ncbi:MAG: DUF447 family protein [Planctomycetaceae bacterium]
MIIEGLVTSLNSDRSVNVAPMGPIVHGDFEKLTLRPFRGSTTYRNLLETGQGVFHIVDDVRLIAEAAIRREITLPATFVAQHVDGVVLQDCCRWCEFRITKTDVSQDRSELQADVVSSGVGRPFSGFNRARHAIIEISILATRLHLIPRSEVLVAIDFLTPAVQKTGGPEELDLLKMLQEFIDRKLNTEGAA